jgi:hypothetical protein
MGSLTPQLGSATPCAIGVTKRYPSAAERLFEMDYGLVDLATYSVRGGHTLPRIQVGRRTDILYFKFAIIPPCHALGLLLSRLGIRPRSPARRTLLLPLPNLRRKLFQLAQYCRG